jgi:outer membrane lipoprotein-sorting protein
MKQLLSWTIAFTFLFSIPSYPQAKKDADEILREVTEKTKSYESIEINFTYNMDNPEAKIHESETGSLLVRGDKYRLDIAGQLIISDGETIWTFIREVDEVQINTVEEDQELLTPSRLLTSYSEQYKSKLVGEERKNGKLFQVIELKPLEDKSYSLVTLKVDKELKRFVRIAIQDTNGNTFTYIVNDFIPDVPFQETDFTFSEEEFPGVEVIDMR